ncbi:hypothetical protein ASG01_03280 [Chryseobacterium sp. Leaf180]|uniref:DUF2891 domain-containing protein n=1 Tax=Chryseobacterium sp. Leaf180 TaxID=1736289 RepID=UPI0006FF4BBF|nr:DUF2891 domain-containing protein [Chryseobacterium sp. Leaf180]KQR94902.1 hypothetical protein ASG01_03280 [Chryseobacterium sp. Leaf180]
MKNRLLAFAFLPGLFLSQTKPKLSDDMALKLAEKPLHCILQEYPNKTAHIINNAGEAALTPKVLHPAFYGCFDWHSSVHGHWMLVRLLKTKPSLSVAKDIENILDQSFTKENLQSEAEYFSKYQLTTTFERTYGWAWLLKLDQELMTWDHPKARIWHQNLKPLTDKIIASWKTYLPKQTYPNRTGVHPNSAFAMAFAIDWARAAKDQAFENQLTEKAKYFFLKDEKTPAYLEPDGSDFFSPSLEIADLMRRVLPQKDFVKWFDAFYDQRSLENIKKIPVVSDLSDYQTVHLVGLSFSKGWCMKGIANVLPAGHPQKKTFSSTADIFLNNALPLLFQGNYGGDHWLSSFAVYALED